MSGVSPEAGVYPVHQRLVRIMANRIGILGVSLDVERQGNMGVGALAYGTIRCLSHQFPQAQMFLLDYGRDGHTHHIRVGGHDLSIPLVNLRFSKRIYLANNIAVLICLAVLSRLLPWKTAQVWLLHRNKWLRAIVETDCFVSLNGGDSFSDLYGMGRLLYVGLPQILVLLLGKRLILLPQTIGPFRSWFARLFAKSILSRAERVYSRDRAGVAVAQAVIGPKRETPMVGFAHDLGFLLEPVSPLHLDVRGVQPVPSPGALRVGINVSALLYSGGYTRNNMFGLREDYAGLIRRILESLLSNNRTDVILVPHVFRDKGDVEGDSWLCEQLFEELHARYPGRLGVTRGRYSPGEIKYVIGQCGFFLGSRMHACIAAISQCVPTVALAYSDKFIGVMESIKMEHVVLDLRRMTVQEILARIEDVNRALPEVRLELKRTVPPIQQVLVALLRDLQMPAAGSLAEVKSG